MFYSGTIMVEDKSMFHICAARALMTESKDYFLVYYLFF